MLLLGVPWHLEGIVTGELEIRRARDDEVRDREGIVVGIVWDRVGIVPICRRSCAESYGVRNLAG